ncbi:TIR domain-containing protein [Methanosarcina sp. MSH10X1]|uniref:TIR domain-containing protein n=1 Tax=Methanosarcina sp. MSH10X1 TaxID=2507075 RepID=UPI000FFC31CB|nr:TIR domain-containing protein [Methanosarcina sp. MSH10X1]RXA20236.1 TIR domain-containing protein [Methanosarcina sp. MSH10X1]
MITKVYIAHCEQDELLAQELVRALWAVELESFSALYRKARILSLGDRIRFGIRQSDCFIPILTQEGMRSPEVNQEIGLAVGADQLVIPLIEAGVELPVLIHHLQPIVFSPEAYEDALGKLIQNLRQLTRLDWLKIKCPYCGEELTQYISPEEEVERALLAGTHLVTRCSYCQRNIQLDPRTFRPVL